MANWGVTGCVSQGFLWKLVIGGLPGVRPHTTICLACNQVLVIGFCLWVPSLGTAGCHTISYPLCVQGVSIKAGDWWSTRYKTSHHHLFGLQASSCTAGVQSNKLLLVMVLPRDSTILPIRNNLNHLPFVHVGISMLEAIPSHVITLSSHWHLVIFYFALISSAGQINFTIFL